MSMRQMTDAKSSWTFVLSLVAVLVAAVAAGAAVVTAITDYRGMLRDDAAQAVQGSSTVKAAPPAGAANLGQAPNTSRAPDIASPPADGVVAAPPAPTSTPFPRVSERAVAPERALHRETVSCGALSVQDAAPTMRCTFTGSGELEVVARWDGVHGSQAASVWAQLGDTICRAQRLEPTDRERKLRCRVEAIPGQASQDFVLQVDRDGSRSALADPLPVKLEVSRLY